VFVYRPAINEDIHGQVCMACLAVQLFQLGLDLDGV
jgi:hypothetical protein